MIFYCRLLHKQYYMSTPPADLSKIMYTPVQDINVSDVDLDILLCMNVREF